MDIEYLRYILVAQELGSISKAGTQLCLSHQHLSRIIAAFEKEVGVTVFTRGRKGILPTKEGEAVLNDVADIVRRIDDLFTRYQPNRFDAAQFAEDVYFYNVQTFAQNRLTDHITRFCQMFPRARFHLQELPLREYPPALEKDQLSVGIVPAVFGGEMLEQMFAKDMALFELEPLQLVALASPQNAEAKRYKSISLKTLLQKDLVFYTPTTLSDNPIYQMLRYRNLLPQDVKFTASNQNMLRSLLNAQPNCFILGFFNSAIRENLQQIPLQKPITVANYLILQRKFLANDAIKIMVNTFLTASNQPPLP